MSLDANLLKEFVKVTNDSETKKENKYIRGTIVKNSNGKFVQLDGSSAVTPISEIVDVEEGDRVLVTIENHKATIVGNFTFPPSARKEQEALDKANAVEVITVEIDKKANAAQIKANEASEKADEAINQSSIASASADEAKEQATEALNKANSAQENIQEAKDLATQANTNATEAKNQAASSQASSANAQAKVTELQGEVDAAKGDIDKALEDLEAQAGEITGIKETYSTKVEVGETKAELETEITKKVGELETKVTETYATKTDNVSLEGRLQTQITQNSEGITSHASKIEKLEGDTAEAQKDVDEALAKAAAAQTTATEAQTKAQAAQEAANTATADANTAAQKAQLAQNAADAATAAANAADQAVQEAQGDLDEAKQNLASVTSRVDATEADIAEAQQKVDAAQESVNEALADAAEARNAANNATEAATKAQQDAETAQGTANAAQTKADNAKTAADNAQAAADKAQEDVAALTSRVTSAETKITQNSNNITINANKTEEIGNTLKNDYYKKTETDAKLLVQSNKIESTVTRVETVEKNLDNLEIGGTNLLRGTNSVTTLTETGTWSDGTWKSASSGTGTRTSIEVTDSPNANIKVGWNITSTEGQVMISQDFVPTSNEQEYTLSCYARGSGKVALQYGNPDVEYEYMDFDVPSDTEWAKFAFTFPSKGEGNVYIGVPGNSDVNICGMKLEKGNVATDWTLAPEDVDSDINSAQNTADEAQKTASNLNEDINGESGVKSQITQLADTIEHLIIGEDGSSLMVQTPDGFRFDMTSINKNLTTLNEAMTDVEQGQNDTNDALNKLKDLLDSVEAKTAYITIGKDDEGNPCIELGKTDNDFKVRITNTAIDFLEGSTKIAYVNNNTFYTEKMIVKNELQIGTGPGFVWKTRSNGNMGLVYISG